MAEFVLVEKLPLQHLFHLYLGRFILLLFSSIRTERAQIILKLQLLEELFKPLFSSVTLLKIHIIFSNGSNKGTKLEIHKISFEVRTLEMHLIFTKLFNNFMIRQP